MYLRVIKHSKFDLNFIDPLQFLVILVILICEVNEVKVKKSKIFYV